MLNWETIQPFITYVFIPIYIATGALCYKYCYICKEINGEVQENSNDSRPIEIVNVFEIRQYSHSDDEKYDFYKKYSQESENEYNLRESFFSDEYSDDYEESSYIPRRSLSTIFEEENESA